MSGAGAASPYGSWHLAVLIGTAATAGAMVLARPVLAGRDDRVIRRWLAGVVLAAGASGWIAGLARHQMVLPLQVCDLATLLAAWALLSLRPFVCVWAYGWGLAGSVQAMLTPALSVPCPSFWWLQFFAAHSAVVLSAAYLAVTGRVRMRASSVWQIWGVTNAYAALAGLINWAAGTNYGFLAHKPAQPSLLDWLGPWPVYLVGLDAAALASFWICYAPFARAARAAGTR